MNCKQIEKFMESLKSDIYTEVESNGEFINSGIEAIEDMVEKGTRVLDVGCGDGYAMKRFSDLGAIPTGITLDKNDIKDGLDVRIMDMSDLSFSDNTFNGIWARHSLEHSIFPYYTLYELKRVLQKGGWIYIEVPAPDTDCQHQCNPNHYSVMTASMWGSLLNRLGFEGLKFNNISFESNMGEDLYYRIVGVKG